MSYHKFIPGREVAYGIYDNIVSLATNDDVIVETRVGLGRGLHYMLERLKATNKRPKVYAFDTFGQDYSGDNNWSGYPSHTAWGEPFSEWISRIGGSGKIIDQFAFYLKNSPASDYLTDWAQFPEWTVHEEFRDSSVSCVILNPPHDGNLYQLQHANWYPKITLNGSIVLIP